MRLKNNNVINIVLYILIGICILNAILIPVSMFFLILFIIFIILIFIALIIKQIFVFIKLNNDKYYNLLINDLELKQMQAIKRANKIKLINNLAIYLLIILMLIILLVTLK